MIKENQKLVFGSSADNPADGLFVTREHSQERGSRSKSKRRSKSKKHKSMVLSLLPDRHIRRNCPKRMEKSGNSANIIVASSDDNDVGFALNVSTNDSRNTSYIMSKI